MYFNRETITSTWGLFHEAVRKVTHDFEYEVPDRMPKVFPDVFTKCDYISNNLNEIMAKKILCIKTVCYNKNVNLHLHSSTLVDAVKK